MSVVLVGNNDGPLRVARSLRAAGYGGEIRALLQKRPPPHLATAYAEAFGVPGVELAENDVSLARAVGGEPPDLIVCAFANFRFRKTLDVAPCANVHLAPLPRYRGRHPMHWALINGEREYGVTLHRMNARFDDGEILWQALIDVGPLWSVQTLREALMSRVDAELGAALLQVLAGTRPGQPNPSGEGYYVPRRYPRDSELVEWDDPARLLRKVYALSSGPNPAYLSYEGERVNVYRGSLHQPEPTSRADLRDLTRISETTLVARWRNGTTLTLSSELPS